MNHHLRPAVLLIALTVLGSVPALAETVFSEAYVSPQSVADLGNNASEIQTAGKWNPVGIDRCNLTIHASAFQHPATFHLKILKFEPYHAYGWSYRIMAPDQTVIIQGCHVKCRIWICFKEDQSDLLARIHKDAVLTFSGTLGRADLRMYDGNPVLSLTLFNATIASDEVL